MMDRKEFLRIIAGATGMMTLGTFGKWDDSLKEDGAMMPVLFIGHGSPMNAIEDNMFSRSWEEMGRSIPRPKAVLCISAHWLTSGTFVTAMEQPRTIHDFGGFPKSLFDVRYPAPGDPLLASETVKMISKTSAGLNHDWGLDHGTWSVVRRMYPDADIPVLQFSIDYTKPMQYHYELASELAALRKKGVLIIGSGNMVHNLGMVAWDRLNDDNYGYDWAAEMNETFKKLIGSRDHKSLIAYEKLGKAAMLSIPSPDHYIPLIYTLGLQNASDEPSFFNDRLVAGSLTMTSVLFSSGLSAVRPPDPDQSDSAAADSL